MQSEYGKVDITDFDVKATPLLWYSFITGLPPREKPLREFGGRLFSSEACVKRSIVSKILEHGHWLQRAIPLQFWSIIIRCGVAYKYMHTMVDYRRRGIETILNHQ